MKLQMIASALLLSSCAVAADNQEFLIGETYDEWVKVTNAKDIDRWWTYVAPAPVFTPPGEPVLQTEAAIRGFYEKLFADPNFSLDCEQQSVEIAASGDMAWARGICNFTLTDPTEKVVRGTSRWFKVWLKQTDGFWKCKVNTWNVGGSQ